MSGRADCRIYDEQIPLHAAGLLPADEAEACAAHLATCSACEAKHAAFAKMVPALEREAPAVAPPPDLKARALARLPGGSAPSGRGMHVVHDALSGGWQPLPVPGVEMKPLFVDEANDRHTVLLRMAAGATFPQHRHAGLEECWVLEGDLRWEDEVVEAGGYVAALPGSLHHELRTEGGCLVLVSASRSNEFV